MSLPFNGTVERAAHIVGSAAGPGLAGATLDGTAYGDVKCVLWIRAADGSGETVPQGKCVFRGADGNFSVVAGAERDALLAELRRLCEGVDPFASSA